MKHVHFLGINGMGMNGLAKLANVSGWNVSGSDDNLTSSDQKSFENMGVSIFEANELPDKTDLLCYSTAIPNDHPSLVSARSIGIELVHRSEFLNLLMQERQSIGVTGSHGKSSTTGILSHIAQVSGLKPSCVLGAQFEGNGQSYLNGNGPIVVEADDHDGTLINIKPDHTVVTNIDYEHIENYGTIGALKAMYIQYLKALPSDGWIVACGDSPHVLDVCDQIRTDRVVTYGYGNEVDVRIEYTGGSVSSSTYELVTQDPRFEGISGGYTTRLAGKHGVLNTTAAITMATLLHWPRAEVQTAAETFEGIRRRMTLVGSVHGALMYNDYAHHPTEITAVLEHLKNSTQGRILVVFEPHRASRVQSLINEFSLSFSSADTVLVSPIHSPGDNLPTNELQERLSNMISENSQTLTKAFSSVSELVRLLNRLNVAANDTIIMLSAGPLAYRADDILKELEKC